MFDMHCHLGFSKDRIDGDAAPPRSLTAFYSATVDLLSYEKDVRRFSSSMFEETRSRKDSDCIPGLFQDDDARDRGDGFEAISRRAPSSAEVGLDFFATRHEETREKTG